MWLFWFLLKFQLIHWFTFVNRDIQCCIEQDDYFMTWFTINFLYWYRVVSEKLLIREFYIKQITEQNLFHFNMLHIKRFQLSILKWRRWAKIYMLFQGLDNSMQFVFLDNPVTYFIILQNGTIPYEKKRKVWKYILDISKLPVSLFNSNMNYDTFNVLLTYSSALPLHA